MLGDQLSSEGVPAANRILVGAVAVGQQQFRHSREIGDPLSCDLLDAIDRETLHSQAVEQLPHLIGRQAAELVRQSSPDRGGEIAGRPRRPHGLHLGERRLHHDRRRPPDGLSRFVDESENVSRDAGEAVGDLRP